MLTLTTLKFEQHNYKLQVVKGKFRGLERKFYLMDSFTLLTNKVRFEQKFRCSETCWANL